MRIVKIISRLFYWVVIITLILLAGFLLISVIDIPGNYKIQSVLSGSMEPAIKTGSVIVIKSQGNYSKGDVISFRDPINLKTNVTHRISGISLKPDNYITKGDANEDRDPSEVAEGNITGKVIFTLPFAGYVTEFLKGRYGLVIMLMISAVIIFNEVLSIKNESIKLLKNKKKKELNFDEGLNNKLL